jgi:6-phosphogluconolactonase
MMGFIVSSKIFISDTLEELSERFAQLLIEGTSNCINYFHLVLSGGSTPKYVFEYLAENYKTKIEWNKIKIFWGDERCVPPDHPNSNYKMALDALISKIKIPEENIFRIHGETNPAEEEYNYSEILIKNTTLLNGLPQFDLLMLGIGEDGHTASIFSNNLDLFKSKKICSVTNHPITQQKRITLNGNVINNAKVITFIATGSDKNKILDIVINRKNGFDTLPASYINPANGELIWFVDNTACGLPQ